jgi:hypothetical protein
MELRKSIREGHVRLPRIGAVRRNADGTPRFIVEVAGNPPPHPPWVGGASLIDDAPVLSGAGSSDAVGTIVIASDIRPRTAVVSCRRARRGTAVRSSGDRRGTDMGAREGQPFAMMSSSRQLRSKYGSSGP